MSRSATAAARRSPASRRATPARRAPAPRPPRSVSPRAPRRVSGPAVGRRVPAAQAGAPLALRVARVAGALPDRPLVDRLVRGQGWIVVIGVLLIGLVAMQVSVLKLSAGIGHAVERSAALERRNGELRAQVSRLSASERVQARAAELGMVLPAAGSVVYLRSRPALDARRAQRALARGFQPEATTVAVTAPAQPMLEPVAPSTPAGESSPPPAPAAAAAPPAAAPTAPPAPAVSAPAAPAPAPAPPAAPTSGGSAPIATAPGTTP
jgi:cell division protein FtsL